MNSTAKGIINGIERALNHYNNINTVVSLNINVYDTEISVTIETAGELNGNEDDDISGVWNVTVPTPKYIKNARLVYNDIINYFDFKIYAQSKDETVYEF